MESILSPDEAAGLLTALAMPFIGMMLIIIIVLLIKDFAAKVSKGIAFKLNGTFKEGDKVILDGEKALVVKIGLTQTVFGITKSGGDLDGDYVWRYVPNERIAGVKLEKLIFDITPLANSNKIHKNESEIQQLKNGQT